MIDIMIEISAYILVAIFLGYFFGWLITRLLYQTYLDKNEFDTLESEELEKMKVELARYKKSNKQLKASNKELSTSEGSPKYVMDGENKVFTELQKHLLNKDEIIQTLTKNLLLAEERGVDLEKKHEEEIDAFMFERIEITQKYKELLVKVNAGAKHKSIAHSKEKWFSKFFSSTAP